MLHIGILTISDRAFAGEYEDKGAPAIAAFLEEAIISPWQKIIQIVPDEQNEIEAALIDLSTDKNCGLIVTTGGTGISPRDVTPEATFSVCTKLLPGFGEAMRAVSLQKVATAILSRQMAGVFGKTLIVNLPGNPKAIKECLGAVFAAIPDALDLIGAAKMQTNPSVCKAEHHHKHDHKKAPA